MEKPPTFEEKETLAERIERRIGEIAEEEGMEEEDIFTDMETFMELLKEDDDVKPYFEELAEKIGVTTEELIEYVSEI